MQRTNGLTPRPTRPNRTVEQSLATGQNFMLGAHIFEDFKYREVLQPADHSPSLRADLSTMHQYGICVNTGTFREHYMSTLAYLFCEPCGPLSDLNASPVSTAF